MAEFSWDWLLRSDGGLAVRIAAGVAFFAVLAAWELATRGRAARRWREYLFLLSAVAVAMAYGVANDQITATISWEYFYYGKGLSATLAPDTPPAEAALRSAAVAVGAKATWTPGLIFGVAFLLANNPRKDRPQLLFRQLYRLLPLPLLLAAGAAAVLGLAGYFGAFARLSEFRMLYDENLWRPARFMCVWGIHLGGYVGGTLGTVAAVVSIVRRRWE